MCFNYIVMTSYDLKLLNESLSHLKTLLGTRISFYDADKHSTDANSRVSYDICIYLKQTLRAECTKSDEYSLNNLPQNQNCHAYKCHFGFIEIAKKAIMHDETAGYFLIGPFRDETDDAKLIKKISKYAEANGFDKDELVKKYKEVPVYTKEKFDSINMITDIFMEWVVSKDIMVDKADLFTSRIEPYIKNNLSEDLSMEALEKRFYLSQKQLYRLFISSTGKSPKKYVTEKRIAEAKRLLWLTDLPMAQVAEKVGIADYNYFIKIFKASEGQTPYSVRKKSHNTINRI